MKYEISGKVVKGDGYGRKLGFPTVNLETKETKLPPSGVYAGNALMNSISYKAGIAIDLQGKVDAHLLGYSGDAYGQEVKLELKTFLREYKKFENEEDLIEQIKEDIQNVHRHN